MEKSANIIPPCGHDNERRLSPREGRARRGCDGIAKSRPSDSTELVSEPPSVVSVVFLAGEAPPMNTTPGVPL